MTTHPETTSCVSWKDEQIIRIAHDLSNPLNSMLGWLYLLENEKLPLEQILPTIRRIRKSARQQSAMIEELRRIAFH